ncbi:MAG: hypothetical protein PHE89_01180 [Alphaproteobacteria bacterium]|nr:hypothetical protein [Alphaproteobacteria bacterium]
MKKIETIQKTFMAVAEVHLDKFIGYNVYGGGIVIIGKPEEGSNHHLYFFEEVDATIVSGRGHYFVFKNLQNKYSVFSCWKKAFKIPYGKQPIKIKRRSFKVGKATYLDRNLNKLSRLGRVPVCKKSELKKYKSVNYVIFEDKNGSYGVYSNIEDETLVSGCLKITNEKHYFALTFMSESGNAYEKYIDGSGSPLFILGERAEVVYGVLPEVVLEEDTPLGYKIIETFHLDKFIGYNLKDGGVVIVSKPEQGTYEVAFKQELPDVQIVSGRGYYFVLESLKKRGIYGVFSSWKEQFKIPLEVAYPVLIKRRAIQIADEVYVDRDLEPLKKLGAVIRCCREEIELFSSADFAIFEEATGYGIYSYAEQRVLASEKVKIVNEEHYFTLIDDDENQPYETYMTGSGKKLHSFGERAQKTFAWSF